MNIIDEVIKSYGDVKAVQVRFGYSAPMGVYNWRTRGIPKDKIVDIHLDTGIDLKKLNVGASKVG
jgi:hypothetical protein